jgi:hypothetical protein
MSARPTRPGRALARLALLPSVVAAAVVAAPAASAAPPAPAAPLAPAQDPTIQVTLDSAAIGSAPGTVELSGTVTCSEPLQVVVYGDVAQVQGLEIARDYYFVDPLVQCSSTPTTWTTTTIGALRVFLPLPTVVSMSTQYCVGDVGPCYTSTTRQTVTLPDATAAA